MKHVSIFLIVCLFVTASNAQSTQTFINKLWQNQTGVPDTIDWSATTHDNQNNIIICGNTTDGSVTNLLLSKYNSSGDSIWEITWSHPFGLNDYGTAVKTDAQNYIYVAATSITSTVNGFDYVIQKRSPAGTLIWTKYYNGPGNSYDVPSDIGIDGQFVYVTGGSYGAGTDLDYCTLKLDKITGNIIWTKRYNYLNKGDVAAAVSIRPNRITVTGGSASTSINWDFYTITYDALGNTVFTRRNSSPYNGYDEVKAIARDGQDNVYLTGQAINGSNYDIQTVKLDSNLNTIWTQVYANATYNDIGHDIAVDANGIYVCGQLGKANNLSNGVLIHYNTSGTELWHRVVTSYDVTQDCKTLKLTIDQSSNVLLASHAVKNSDYGIDLVMFNASGSALWSHRLNPSSNNEKPISIKQSANDIYYLAYRTSGVVQSYWIAAFKTMEITNNISLADSTTFSADYLSNQLIVRFRPDLVNASFVDNRDRQYTALEDIIPDSILAIVSDVTGYDFTRDVTAIKIFLRMTTADSISVSRLGNDVHMDKLWSAFRLMLPDSWDLKVIIDSLTNIDSTSLLPFYVMYFHPDYVGYPNADPLEEEQEGLLLNSNGDYPLANINMEAAWAIEPEGGSSTVKVGVIDEVIYWNHEDFGAETGYMSDTKITAGWDYTTNTNVSDIPNPQYYHGTACAGIIGELRNNGKGIAGITGGDVDGPGNTGCQLISLCASVPAYTNIEVYTYLSLGANAIVEGSADINGTYGYELNIENASWGLTAPTIFNAGIWGELGFNLLKDAVKSCVRNECLLVAARGNLGSISAGNPTEYPACFRDEWVLNVGATGTNGERKIGSNGFGSWESSYGFGMDVEAPGCMEIVATTIIPNQSFYCMSLGDTYECFDGSSAATAHVSGLAALMMSHHTVQQGYGADLAPEDVQQLIKKNSDLYPIYDTENAYGKINAGAAMAMIDAPHYKIFHNELTPQSTSYTTGALSLHSFIDDIYSDYANSTTTYLPAGFYYGYLVERLDVYSYTFNSTTEVIDYWARYNSSTGYSPVNPYNGITGAQYFWGINGNTATVTTVTKCFHLYDPSIGLDAWFPNEQSYLRADFSLHLFDPEATGIDDRDGSINFDLYPNPSTDNINISIVMPESRTVDLEITDITGRIVLQTTLDKSTRYLYPVNISDWSSGMYLCKISGYREPLTKKFIKL